jgi:hypothetical protein
MPSIIDYAKTQTQEQQSSSTVAYCLGQRAADWDETLAKTA